LAVARDDLAGGDQSWPWTAETVVHRAMTCEARHRNNAFDRDSRGTKEVVGADCAVSGRTAAHTAVCPIAIVAAMMIDA
jgi:hypothetical protein